MTSSSPTLLVIGSGGREHAITESLLRSARTPKVFVAPGNAGTEPHNVALDVGDHGAVAAFCAEHAVDLVVVGPEAPLVAGLVDDLTAAGVACFGPTAAAAQLEGSKAFTREFAARHGIPGPRFAQFHDVEAATNWLDEVQVPVVVKADGLAAGKGVVVPKDRVETERAIFEMLAGGSMGEAGASIVLEERMEGEELSLIAFCDGTIARTLPPAQDHKRVGVGDTGPNTGGMGAFAPVPGVTAEQVAELEAAFLQAAVDGMAADGTPYVGLLYAGLMMTPDGPRLVEYNARFGDPEAQVLLALLETDLLEVVEACTAGRLGEVEYTLSDRTAVTVVACAEGYPSSVKKDIPIPDVELPAHTSLIHAGTARNADGAVVSSGGRVLNVVATGDDLAEALQGSYEVIHQLTSGTDLFARPDIGWRHAPGVGIAALKAAAGAGDAYAAAGVSFEAGDAAIDQIADAVKETHTDRVVAGVGSFGGVFDLAGLGLEQPLLVSSTDTCGTKTVLAAELNMWDDIGADIVNHGVNDVLVQGAKPLFMLDTISAGSLDPDIVGRVVRSMAAACRENACVLLGGETAEVPDLIVPGGVDVAGTMVGVVDRSALLPRPDINPGDVLIGLASSGLHTNGYSLARKLGAAHGFNNAVPGTDIPLGIALLAPHRSYLAPLAQVLDGPIVKALAHLTGGGFPDNIPRCLPAGLGAEVDTSTWQTPPLFDWLQRQAGIDLIEAHRIFNMGIGMVAVVAPEHADAFDQLVPEPTYRIGRIVEGSGVDLS